MVLIYNDNSLSSTDADTIPDVSKFDAWEKGAKKRVRSQAGCVVRMIDQADEDKLAEVPCSVLDWKSTGTKRVVTSTFAAETTAAISGLGCGMYCRAPMCRILHDCHEPPGTWGETHLPMRLMTDCRSLYDHVGKEGSLPDCRWISIHVACLQQEVSCGPQRHPELIGLKWVASRWQMADGLSKEGLSESTRLLMAKGTVRLHEMSAQVKKILTHVSKEM